MTCFKSFTECWPLVWKWTYDDLVQENIDLHEQLQIATRNDTPKDPVTGQFTSAKKGTFTTGG